MASSLSCLSLQLQIQSPKNKLSSPSSSKLSTTRFATRIRASVSEKPAPAVASGHATTKLPLRKIPGDYGIPFLGAIKDRLDYFYNQGKDEYFKSRAHKYESTVYRANMPPGPLIAQDPRVIVLLDGKSFPVLFDVSKVDKKDLFTGTFMPSTEFTGGYRILSYLDPSEPNHAKLKQLIFFLLKSCRDRVIPEFHSSYTELFEGLEMELSSKGKAEFNNPNEQAAFNFLGRAMYGTNPVDTKLGSDGPKLIGTWVLAQLAPLLTLGLPGFIEDPLLHTVRLPPQLVKSNYQRLYDYFYESAGFVLDAAQKMGISREEACHNIIFATCFNTFGGFKIFFPNIMKWIGRGGVELHTRLAQEIRTIVRSNDGKVTMAGIEQMELMKSTVYEVLRIDPPVPAQYGRAKRDMVIESHEAAFEVKAGEMLFGFQPFATKDPKIFERAEEFVADRFVGEGEKLLKHVVWSNGPETETPSLMNKQCAGKDFVVLAARLLVIELFLRYDSFDMDVTTAALGSTVTIKSLKRASF